MRNLKGRTAHLALKALIAVCVGLLALAGDCSHAAPEVSGRTQGVRIVDFGGYADYDGAWAQDIICRRGTVYDVDCDGDGSVDDDYVAFNAYSDSEPYNPPFPYWNTYRPSMVFLIQVTRSCQ